jgi:hypothetical protein
MLQTLAQHDHVKVLNNTMHMPTALKLEGNMQCQVTSNCSARAMVLIPQPEPPKHTI